MEENVSGSLILSLIGKVQSPQEVAVTKEALPYCGTSLESARRILQTHFENMVEKTLQQRHLIWLIKYSKRPLKLRLWSVFEIIHIFTNDLSIGNKKTLKKNH